ELLALALEVALHLGGQTLAGARFLDLQIDEMIDQLAALLLARLGAAADQKCGQDEKNSRHEPERGDETATHTGLGYHQ
ncbi:MAG: hypothetical protein AAGC55_20980, partial [Myxococcota bacterium]